MDHEGIDESYWNVARQLRHRLPERDWRQVVDMSRTMTMDCMTLGDVATVALAYRRATMLSVSIANGFDNNREQIAA
jgi:hypothetical protein